MCNACGNLCCGSDEFKGCGCYHCGHPDCADTKCWACGDDYCDGDCQQDEDDLP